MNTNIRDVIKDKSVKIRLRWKWLLAMGVIMGIVMSQCSNGLEPVNMEDKPLEKPLPINTRPKILAIGSGFSVGIKPDGTVWTWGTNHHGILARPIKTKEEGYEPGQVHGLKGAVSVVASDCVLVLMKDGTVWSWGKNDHGQLGYVTQYEYSNVPRAIPEVREIIDIVTLGGSSQALDKNGRVWGWGWNVDGMLGITEKSDHVPVSLINGLDDIRKIVIGYGASYAINKYGDLFSYGKIHHMLGRDVKENRWLLPEKIAFRIPVVDISSQGNAAYALTADGRVWSWGKNTGGELGIENKKHGIYPERVRFLSRIIAIASDSGGAVINDIGDVAIWGVSAGGPPPPPPLPRHDLFIPYSIGFRFNPPIKYIFSGSSAYAAIDRDGDVWYWMANSQGQRGTGVAVRDPDSTYWLTLEKSHWSYR